MAAITVQPAGTGYTPAAASAGGDTVVSGTKAGGWGLNTVLVYAVGATATTITVDGTAFGPYTSQTVVIPVSGGIYKGRVVNITYNQAASVTVGATEV
jgi:hypothetical protein